VHLKNFSLFKDPKLGYNLSLAYDMVAAALVVEGDDEELALNLNGRKKKLRRKDFEVSAELFKMDKKVLGSIGKSGGKVKKSLFCTKLCKVKIII
jgi:serine/threonine-protein kinase HipA